MNTNDYATNLIQITDSASRLYFRLILMVGPAGSGRTSVLQEVSASAPAALVNVNIELSRQMLDLPERKRALLREFEEYRESKQKRLKVLRLEAVRAGFKKAWRGRDYATVIAVARKIPENVLQEDPKLLMWYVQALTRSGEEE